MSIREAILERIKGLRKGDIEICTDQNVKQEEKLSEFRMEVMGILLDLVDADASTIDNLKGISKKLLDFRKTISDEVSWSTESQIMTYPGDASVDAA